MVVIAGVKEMTKTGYKQKKVKLRSYERRCIEAWRAFGINIEPCGKGLWCWINGFAESQPRTLVDIVEELGKYFDPRWDYVDHDHS